MTPAQLRRFYPGGVSTAGFLAVGEDLDTVLRSDAETLARLQVDARALGLALKALLDRYHELIPPGALPFDLSSAALTDWVADTLHRGGLTTHVVQVTRWRGFQMCPFPDCAARGDMAPHSQTDWTITHRATGQAASGPGLLWHLAAEHGFFEGPGSPYRVNPEALASVLGLSPA